MVAVSNVLASTRWFPCHHRRARFLDLMATTVDTRKKQAEHLARKIDNARTMLAKFDQNTISEILRRPGH